MIILENFGTRKDGVRLVRRYSDKGVMIQKVGTDELYNEAIDLEGAAFLYEETGKQINELQAEV